jgi:hypothetical protein
VTPLLATPILPHFHVHLKDLSVQSPLQKIAISWFWPMRGLEISEVLNLLQQIAISWFLLSIKRRTWTVLAGSDQILPTLAGRYLPDVACETKVVNTQNQTTWILNEWAFSSKILCGFCSGYFQTRRYIYILLKMSFCNKNFLEPLSTEKNSSFYLMCGWW